LNFSRARIGIDARDRSRISLRGANRDITVFAARVRRTSNGLRDDAGSSTCSWHGSIIQEGDMLILFGGGDGGGIYVGPDGKVHRIPPWSPDVQAQLKAVSALVALEGVHETGLAKEAAVLAERLSTKVIPQITKSVGTQQLGDTSIAFVDGDDGFVCGSTGKHPIPVPHRVATNLYSPVTSQEPIRV
jgi:hypothetical protein